jgi:hypothetical protein
MRITTKTMIMNMSKGRQAEEMLDIVSVCVKTKLMHISFRFRCTGSSR